MMTQSQPRMPLASIVFAVFFPQHLAWNGRIMLLKDNAAAYIVRVWLEHREVEDAPVEWRGSIEHVGSGQVKYLTQLNEIERFIRPFLRTMGVDFAE